MQLEFFNEPFDIKPGNKITLYRFNYGENSPFMGKTEWSLNSKAVSTNHGDGIYCITLEMLEDGGGMVVRDILGYRNSNANEYLERDLVCIELEADKNDILFAREYELSVIKCNIVSKMTISELAFKYPIYSNIAYWWKCSRNQSTLFDYAKSMLSVSEKMGNKMAFINNWIYNQNDKNIHGYKHSLRVSINTEILCDAYGIRSDISYQLKNFAFFHDLYRVNDGCDPEHGKRAAEAIKRSKEREHSQMRWIPDDIIDKLCFACKNHTHLHKSGDPIIDICFDADRLDLPRVGIMPEPKKMATYIGAHYAENLDAYAHQFMTYYEKNKQ